MVSRVLDFKPHQDNCLIRLCAPPRPSSVLHTPETADDSIATGHAMFPLSGKGTTGRVLAIGGKVTEVKPGDLVLVDRMCGDLVDELEGVSQDRELRMVCEPAIVAVLEFVSEHDTLQ